MIPAITQLRHFKAAGAGKWIACCPAHKDKSPSLSIRTTDDGKTLLHCHAGCSVESIVSTLGISMGELFPDGRSYDPKEWKRSKHREIYQHEKLVLQMHKADKENNKTISSEDKRRAALARSRVVKLERMWGGSP